FYRLILEPTFVGQLLLPYEIDYAQVDAGPTEWIRLDTRDTYFHEFCAYIQHRFQQNGRALSADFARDCRLFRMKPDLQPLPFVRIVDRKDAGGPGIVEHIQRRLFNVWAIPIFDYVSVI